MPENIDPIPIAQSVTKFIGCEKTADEADICLFGAPFDSTASFRPGSRFAPQAMRSDSWALETYSPYQDGDLEDKKVCDCGDLELPLGDTEAALEMIKNQAAAICDAGKIPFMIGGEHLVTLGAVRAALEKYLARVPADFFLSAAKNTKFSIDRGRKKGYNNTRYSLV